MPLIEKITSLQNPRVKDVAKMHRSRARRESGLIIVEGLREISMALEAEVKMEYLMACPPLFAGDTNGKIPELLSEHKHYEVTAPVFAKMAYREQSDGLLAVMEAPEPGLDDIQLSKNPLIIVLESVEKPGNLGAVLRTADAANADAVIVCDPLTDAYNPNVIRSSLGCVFTKQVVSCSSEQALEWLQQKGIEPIAASLEANHHHYSCDLTKPLAFVMGAEAAGLSSFWLNNIKTHVKIPMLGKVDSLNVSVSTAVLLYEALRQRKYGE